VINLNYIANFPLEDPGQLLVILVVLAEHDDLIGKFILLVLSFEILAGLVKQDLILEKGQLGIMIVLIHLLYLPHRC
jgi:hypothetical protein